MKRGGAPGRREFLKTSAAAALALASPAAGFASERMQKRRIPASGEEIPVVGLGTSDEFEHVPADGGRQLKAVLAELVDAGGTLVDTAPAYGHAERVLGGFFRESGLSDTLFISTKVSARGEERGLESMERSAQRLGKEPLDLLMVHSLVDARTHLETLRRRKEDGRVRYIGITTSRESGFEEMESLIRSQPLDFIQVNYSPMETRAAERVIPAAAERGIAVMVNRPFGNGAWFGEVAGGELPAWAAEFDCESWAQFSLKYILGHPHVTCVLAATSNPRHMRDNARAGMGRLPGDALRRRIVDYVENL